MEEHILLSYIETCPYTTPILSTAQARWLLVGHVRRFLQFLAVLGLIVYYLVSSLRSAHQVAESAHTRERNIGASPSSPRLPEAAATLLSVTLWRTEVVKSGYDVLNKLSRDRTLVAFLSEGDHDHKLSMDRTLVAFLSEGDHDHKLSMDRTLVAFLSEGDHDHKLNLYRTTETFGTGPNILRFLGLRTSGGHSRNKAADSGMMKPLLGWTADEHPLQADARTKAIRNFGETYRIIARDRLSDSTSADNSWGFDPLKSF